MVDGVVWGMPRVTFETLELRMTPFWVRIGATEWLLARGGEHG